MILRPRTALLAAACTLALAACGGDDTPPAATAPSTAATPAATPAPAPAPVDTPAVTPPPAAATPGSDKPAAVVTDCATTINANDVMQYDVGSITVPASCTQFTITLHHVGQLAEAAMGHNVVIAKAADVAAIASDGMAAGVDAQYVKPDDARVVAHTDMIGGGETTSVTFDVAKISSGGPFQFFCSFPGHSAIMKGEIGVGGM